VERLRAAMRALGHPPEALEILIVQLVTLLRDGQPVRMSKRRGEFVLMEELLEEVGRDAARFTFLGRRHDGPLDFDLAVAARQTADNPVYYVQYAHARIRSIARQAAEQGLAVPPWDEVDTSMLTLPDEQRIVKRLLQFPDVVAGAARALEPHRVAYWLQELAGLFHPYYRAHRVLQEDRALSLGRLALCAAVGRVVANGLIFRGERTGDDVRTWRQHQPGRSVDVRALVASCSARLGGAFACHAGWRPCPWPQWSRGQDPARRRWAGVRAARWPHRP
jgi:arginyl-tRNA synthetase